jgi:acyl-CoA synthetase (NDP forming)
VTEAAVAAMLDPRSVAVVGASSRAGSFGARMVAEVMRGSGRRRVSLINPRYGVVAGHECLPDLRALDHVPDLVLLGVPDAALIDQLACAAERGVKSAVIFGSAHGAGLRDRIQQIAADAGMALCGPGCMGFVNVTAGLRAVGYQERDELAAGPLAVVTHSGSIFSTLLRTRRGLGFTLAVSSGQELVTTTADYVEYLLARTETGVIALVLETVRDGHRLVPVLRRATDSGVAVVVLPTAGSPVSSGMVTAHSGALAGSRATWEALCEGTGALPVADLAELTDTLELLCSARRPRRRGGIATVHDSGAERTLIADLAHEMEVPFAALTESTRRRIAASLEPGLTVDNPLDVWGTGAQTRELFRDCLLAMSSDPGVALTALAVDLVPEYDGDTSYPDAVLDAANASGGSFVVLAGLPSAIDEDAAAQLRAADVPVLEGFRSGLVAIRNALAATSAVPLMPPVAVDRARQARWRDRLADQAPLGGAEALQLLADYGVPVVAARPAASEPAALAAAHAFGYPVVLKTDEPRIVHKTEVAGVQLGLADDAAVRVAYRDLAARLGPRVLVCPQAAPGIELALGMLTDPHLGPLVVVAAGGTLTELLADRAVALPPLDRGRAQQLLHRTRLPRLLAGWRGGPAASLDPVLDALMGVSALAVELGANLTALDVNPLIAAPGGAVAVDALVVKRQAEELRCTA